MAILPEKTKMKIIIVINRSYRPAAEKLQSGETDDSANPVCGLGLTVIPLEAPSRGLRRHLPPDIF
ncbi:hypothetical protein BHZ80_23470 [Salmonella enterica]|nr:hypothetical protein [Salmonella enterica]EAA9597792.1 hypothetical protein [Salmonella enterica]EAM2983630.1 hypothetical protein [Salmonella enterica]EAO9640062.1 hypothetical protein [Salmonella enterica]